MLTWRNTSGRSARSIWLLTGASNFPTRRNHKNNNASDGRRQDLNEYRSRALAAMEKALHPERRPIMSGDADAMSRLTAKVMEAEALQTTMRAVNAAIRRNAKAGKEAQIAAILEIDPALGLAQAALLLQPDYLGRVGYADYEFSNNNANSRRRAKHPVLSF